MNKIFTDNPDFYPTPDAVIEQMMIYDKVGTLDNATRNKDWGEWFEWGFFRCKAFKKGTMHFEFIDENVWLKFNYEVAKNRGWRLPKVTPKENRKRK